jgi:hypothetical protein
MLRDTGHGCFHYIALALWVVLAHKEGSTDPLSIGIAQNDHSTSLNSNLN